MPIPRIHRTEVCPLEGYETLSVRLLVNPTGAEYADWTAGNLGLPECADCAALRTKPVPRGRRARPAEPDADAPLIYCPRCTASRERFGRAAVALYGPRLLDMPCATPAEALALLGSDQLPGELLIWLMLLPESVIARRQDDLIKNLNGSATTPARSQSSTTTTPTAPNS